MLKIRDDVDLKELEKYGFEYAIPIRNGWYDNNKGFSIFKDTRKITICYEDDEIDLIILYDLIKDGLVEKVD